MNKYIGHDSQLYGIEEHRLVGGKGDGMRLYEEAGNGLFGTSKVSDSPILKGTLMSEERAELIGGLNEYIDLNDLRGSDCIVYGYAPSLAYVLGVRPVISSWPDLESYSVLEMKNDINKIFSSVEALERECPLIIEDNEPSTGGVIDNPEKIAILHMVKEKYGYTETYTNGRYSIWTSLWKK